MKIVYVDIDRCIACLSCERICTIQQAKKNRSYATNIFVKVDLEHRRILTATCVQCDSAACMAACPAQALQRDPLSQAIVVDRESCIGCGTCVSACPYGSVYLDEIRRVAAKCDLCDGDPQCVQACMSQALHFGELKDLLDTKRHQENRHLAVRALPQKPPAKIPPEEKGES
jgi:Fe-S-cluster-containing dehydrogenase component